MSASGELTLRTLDQGAQTAEEIGGGIAAWLGEAHRTLDLALYDVRLPGRRHRRGGDQGGARARGARADRDPRP